MKLSYIHICGFRGYRKPVRVDFGSGFTVIDGRNGSKKSTLCDAIEFALTGNVSKYGEARAAGETIGDYIWLRGEHIADDYFVEIGVEDDNGNIFSVTRRRGERQADGLEHLRQMLCDPQVAPESPLEQFCRSAIIRDEHIAALSLDLSETQRFQFLRDALGALNADEEVKRAETLDRACEKRRRDAETEVSKAQEELTKSAKRIDDVRGALVDDDAIREASSSLESILGVTTPLDGLASAAREALAPRRGRIERLKALASSWSQKGPSETRLADLEPQLASFRERLADAEERVAQATRELEQIDATARGEEAAHAARLLADLVTWGARLGLHEHRCPLCSADRTEDEYAAGLAKAAQRANDLNFVVAEIARQRRGIEERLSSLRIERQSLTSALSAAEGEASSCRKVMSECDKLRAELRLDLNATFTEMETALAIEQSTVSVAEQSLSVIDTLSLNEQLQRAIRDNEVAKVAAAEAERRFARARKGKMYADVIHAAARRTANETLARRLDRIGPLLSELYRRLRPHPQWRDMDYVMRGDVRRFLRLEVGNSLNPQFLFSSGQRRVTGLAFLLSIYLSTSWSRLKSIILDDPVQHVDDFRAVHLAEVLAVVRAQGHQIVCAVEDAALADLICRRLSTSPNSDGLRLTLGEDEDGSICLLRTTRVSPLPQSVFLLDGEA